MIQLIRMSFRDNGLEDWPRDRDVVIQEKSYDFNEIKIRRGRPIKSLVKVYGRDAKRGVLQDFEV